jgi:TatD DNase family protein
MYRLIDTHAHLSDLEDLEAALQHALDAGVYAIVAVSADMETSVRTLRIAEEHPRYIYPALGLHPTEMGGDYQDALRFIEERIERCIAVGEVGLDFWRRQGEPGKTEEERQRQISVYTKQLEVARRHRKPALIHGRGAWETAYSLAESIGVSKALFHWYTGPLGTLRALLDRGYLISATPAAEYSKIHREAIRRVPLEQLVLETDCPVAYHGTPSEPTDVLRTLRAVAELKGIPEEEVAEATTRNALEFFNLP